MAHSTTLGLDYFEHFETTGATPQVLWAWWVDVPTWGDWSDWSRGSVAGDRFALGSRGVVNDRFGRRLRFTVTSLDPYHSMSVSVHAPGALLTARRDIVERSERVTTFKHSAWVEGPLARLWRRPLRQRFSTEAGPHMRRLSHLADGTVVNHVTARARVAPELDGLGR